MPKSASDDLIGHDAARPAGNAGVASPARDEAAELRLLFEVSQTLESGGEIGAQLDKALELMARYTGMRRGSILLVDDEREEAVLESSYGLSKAEKSRARYKAGEGVTGRVMATGKPMLVPHISCEPRFLNKTGARDPDKEDPAFICVPIILDGQTVGVLSADRLFDSTVHLEEDMRLLQILASLVARAVKTRRDYKRGSFSFAHAAVLEENRHLQTLVRSPLDTMDLIGASSSLKEVMAELAQVSASSTTVLIRGESGTGKELIAALIHANSPRAGRPFIKVNCAALPEGLVESELFGHERGAFTGAVSLRKGRFEMADSGTLFLDEVGDMSLPTQAKLLRAIQEKSFERVGGGKAIEVDVRLIAATNRDLEKMVEDGAFRADLYYRLSVFPIVLPPLRERQADILPLAAHFCEKFSLQNNRRIARLAPDAAALLMAYSWPGNIREMENVIERATLLAGHDARITAAQLPSWLRNLNRANHADTLSGNHDESKGTLYTALENLESRMIEKAMRESHGNISKAALSLGVSERIMGLRLKKYGLAYKDFRKPDPSV